MARATLYARAARDRREFTEEKRRAAKVCASALSPVAFAPALAPAPAPALAPAPHAARADKR
jgi:hypothetical protein